MSAVADDVGLVVVDSTAVVVSSCIFGRNQNRIDSSDDQRLKTSEQQVLI